MCRVAKDTIYFDSYQRTIRHIRYQKWREKLMRMLRRSSFLSFTSYSTLPCGSFRSPPFHAETERVFLPPTTEFSAAAFYGEPIMNFFSRYKTWFVGLLLFLSLAFSSLAARTPNFLKRREVSRSRTLISLAALLITHGVLSSLPPIEAPFPYPLCDILVSPTFTSDNLFTFTPAFTLPSLSRLLSSWPRKILFWSWDCAPVMFLALFFPFFHVQCYEKIWNMCQTSKIWMYLYFYCIRHMLQCVKNYYN